VDVKVTGSPLRLAPTVEMNLLRIGQEAVTNAIKHGHAKNVTALLQYEREKVRLSITDDGRGFRPQDSPPSGHFGLLDMRERAHSMGCTLAVESAPDCGTKVAIEIPLKTEEEALR